MDFVKQWALTLIATAAFSTLVVFLTPSGNAEKTIRAVVGIFVIVSVCSPLADAVFESENLFSFSFEQADTEFGESVADSYSELLEESLHSQIDSAAQEFGVTLTSIEAEISAGESGCIIIHNITVNASGNGGSEAEGFTEYLEKLLGLPVEISFAAEG